jgi:DNA modification methylase
MATLNNRNFIGCDISKEYVDVATTRIENLNNLN